MEYQISQLHGRQLEEQETAEDAVQSMQQTRMPMLDGFSLSTRSVLVSHID